MDEDSEADRGEHNAATRWGFTAQIVACVVAAVLLTLLATLGRATFSPVDEASGGQVRALPIMGPEGIQAGRARQ
jgi:hypothetical protein